MIYSTDIKDLGLVNAKAFEFLEEHDMAELADGRYELDDKDYVNVMSYDTKPRADGVYEAHDDYIDIQVVIKGEELLVVAPRQSLEQPIEVNAESDYMLFDGFFDGDVFTLRPGSFAYLEPQDAHMPSIAVSDPATMKKAVFKIAVR